MNEVHNEGIEGIKEHLDRIESTLNEVLSLIKPVHEHAAWVDGLRDKLHQWKVLPRGGNNLLTEH
jgi:hypothetical protein